MAAAIVVKFVRGIRSVYWLTGVATVLDMTCGTFYIFENRSAVRVATGISAVIGIAAFVMFLIVCCHTCGHSIMDTTHDAIVEAGPGVDLNPTEAMNLEMFVHDSISVMKFLAAKYIITIALSSVTYASKDDLDLLQIILFCALAFDAITMVAIAHYVCKHSVRMAVNTSEKILSMESHPLIP